MFHSNNTTNASSDVQELGPFDTVYTVVELSSGGCLAMVIITYLLTKRRQSSSGKLMINFSLSLLSLYVESAANKFISASGNDTACVVIGVVGHWIFLTMVTGLAAYALWIYIKVVWVFAEEPRRYALKATIVTWVVPLLVALITVARGYGDYRKTTHLFVCKSHGYAFYLGTILPAVILLLFVLVSMTISIVHICKSQCNRVEAENQNDQWRVKIKRRMKVFLGLLIMVVLGWGSAVIASDEDTPPGLHIFLFIPFLLFGFGQGFYLFFFTCVFSSSVRQDWKKMASRAAHLSVKTIKSGISSSSTDSEPSEV